MTTLSRFVAIALAIALPCAGAFAGSPLNAARVAFDDGMYESAIATCEKALAHSNLAPADRVELEIILADSMLKSNRPTEALAVVEKAAEGQAKGKALDSLLRLQSAAHLKIEGLSDRTIKLLTRIDGEASSPETRSANLLDWAQACVDAGIAKDAMEHLARQEKTNCTNATLAAGMLLHSDLLLASNDAIDKPCAKSIAIATNLLSTVSSADWAEPIQRTISLAKLARIADENLGDTSLACDFAAKALAAIPANAPERNNIELRCGDILAKNPSTLASGAKAIKSAIANIQDDNVASVAQLNLANAYLRHECFTNAIVEFKTYIDTYTNSLTCARQGLAQAYLGKGDNELAATEFGKAAMASLAISRNDLAAKFYLDEARALVRAAKYSDADECLGKIIGDFAGTDIANRAIFLRADALERAGNQQAALAAFADAAKASTNSAARAEAFFRQGLIHERANRYEGANKNYTQSISELLSEPSDAGSNASLIARARLARGRIRVITLRNGALADLNAACGFEETREEASYLKIQGLYNDQLDEEAAKACEKFLADFPESPFWIDAKLWLAKYCFNDKTDYLSAEKLFLESVAHNPSNRWADAALIWAGRSALRRADYAGAVTNFDNVAKNYPHSARLPEAKFLQAGALIEMARFKDAILLLDQITVSWPDSDMANSAMGRKGDCLFSLGAEDATHYEEAMQAYLAVRSHPDVTFVQALQSEFKIGRCLEKLGKTDEARKQYYDRVILRFEGADPQPSDGNAQSWYSRAALQLADILVSQGKYESIKSARNILERIAAKGIDGSDEAKARLDRINDSIRSSRINSILEND